MKKLVISICFFAFISVSYSQVKKLQDYIEQGHNFKEICSKAEKMIRKNKLEEEHYREGEFRTKSKDKLNLDDERLKFERWKWYWRDRLTEDGKFPDLQRQWSLYNEVIRDSKLNNRSAVMWKHEGPVKNSGGYWGMGRATHVDFHPSLSNIFYVASPNGGLWKTTDNGKTYVSIADNLPYQPVGIVIVDPRAPNTLYITLGEKDGWWQYSMGVYKTTDGGLNWNPTGLNWKLTDNKVIYGLEMNPKNTSILIAATSDGLYKTWNGGNTWTKIRTENFSDIKYKPGDTTIVYAASNDYWGESNVYKSVDGGNTFAQVTHFGLQKVFLRFAVTKANPNYLGVNMSVDGGRKFYLSKDQGQNFNYISDPPENSVLYFSQNDPGTLYCGYLVIYKSNDEGRSWNQITNWWNSGTYPEVHADHHFIAAHPTKKSELYFCCDGGLYRLHENTGQWDELVNGLTVTQFYKLAVSTNSTPVIIGGSQDNGGWVRHENGSWGNTNGGDAMTQVIDPSNKDIGYTEYWGGNAVYRSTDGFYNFDDITQNIGAELPGQWVTPFGLNPKNPATFIIGYNEIFISHDRCNTFTKLTTNLTGSKDNDLRDVKISPADTNLIVATRANIMYISKDYGKTWKQSTLATGLDITGFEFHPKDPNRIWCTRSGYGAIKVMTTKDKGNTWTNITRNFVNTPVSCIIYDEPTNTLFAGTDFGVFYSDADNVNWQYYGNGLPHTSVTDLKIHQATRRLYVATYGRGFYSIGLPECSNAEIKIVSRIEKNQFIERDTLITCEGASVQLKARDSLSGMYHWTGPFLDTILINDPVLYFKNNTSYSLANGTYVLEFTSDSGCVQFDTIVVKVLSKPNIFIDPQPSAFDCHHDSILLKSSLTDHTHFEYRWTGPGLDIISDSCYIKQSGVYYLVLKNLEAGCDFYESFEANALSNPVLDSRIIKDNICYGDSSGFIKVHVIAGKSPYTFMWSNQAAGSENNQLKAGIYQLTVSDANLCETTDSFKILQPEDFNVSYSINPSNGNDGYIDPVITGATPPYSFLWTQNGGAVILGNSRNLFNLPPGLYDFKITDANDCMYVRKGIEVKEFVSSVDPENSDFMLYPNPAQDFINLKFKEDPDPFMDVQLFDINGQAIQFKYVKKISQRIIQIRIDQLSKGEYFIKVSDQKYSDRIRFSKL